MQRVKLEDQATPEPEDVPAGSTKSEIFIMMPLDIIAVGEQKEGESKVMAAHMLVSSYVPKGNPMPHRGGGQLHPFCFPR